MTYLPYASVWTRRAVERRIMKLVSETFTEFSRISKQTEFVRDLGADSLLILDLLMEVEEEFSLNPTPDDFLDKLKNVGQLVDFVCSSLEVGGVVMDMDREKMFEICKSALLKSANFKTGVITETSNISLDLGLDSVGWASAIFVIEDRASCSLAPENMQNVETVGELLDLVMTKLEK